MILILWYLLSQFPNGYLFKALYKRISLCLFNVKVRQLTDMTDPISTPKAKLNFKEKCMQRNKFLKDILTLKVSVGCHVLCYTLRDFAFHDIALVKPIGLWFLLKISWHISCTDVFYWVEIALLKIIFCILQNSKLLVKITHLNLV